MADEKPKGNPVGDLFFILAIIVVLIVLWFATGGPERANLKGIFLSPPPPLGTGESYGPGSETPENKTSTTSTPTVQEAETLRY